MIFNTTYDIGFIASRVAPTPACTAPLSDDFRATGAISYLRL